MACIVENLSTWSGEQPLCKTHSRGSELFQTNLFLAMFWHSFRATLRWKFNLPIKNKTFHSNLSDFLPSFIVNLLYYSFCNCVECVLLENKVNFTNLVICLLYWLLSLRAVNLHLWLTCEISRGVFQIMPFVGKCFLFSPPPNPSIFFCCHSNIRSITRLETLATQAKNEFIG